MAQSRKLARRPKLATYEFDPRVLDLLARRDPSMSLWEGGKQRPNLAEIARRTGLSLASLTRLRDGDQALTLDTKASLEALVMDTGLSHERARTAVSKFVRRDRAARPRTPAGV